MPGVGGHPMSLLPPTPSGAAWPPKSYCSLKECSVRGLAQADHRYLNPQGLSKSLSLSFFICKMGLTIVPPCAKGPVWKELRHSQIFTKTHFASSASWHKGWPGPGHSCPEWCQNVGLILFLAAGLCPRVLSLWPPWGQPAGESSPGTAVSTSSGPQHPACAERVTGSLQASPGTQARGRCLVSTPSQQPLGSCRSPVCTVAEVPGCWHRCCHQPGGSVVFSCLGHTRQPGSQRVYTRVWTRWLALP